VYNADAGTRFFASASRAMVSASAVAVHHVARGRQVHNSRTDPMAATLCFGFQHVAPRLCDHQQCLRTVCVTDQASPFELLQGLFIGCSHSSFGKARNTGPTAN